MTTSDAQQLDTLLSAVKAHAPLIRAHAEEAERNRHLSPPVVAALTEAGLFRLYTPRALGGLEVPPSTLYRVVEEVARIDGSTGWCAFIGAVVGVFGAFLPDAVAEQIFGTDPEVVLGGALFPPGTATVCDGGYRVSGHWSYASGCHHCTWLIGGCTVLDNGKRRLSGEAPEMRIVYVPRSQAMIVEDSWQVSGLAGTGSNDFILEDVFVPEDHTHSLGPHMPRGAHFQGPLYATYPLLSAFGFPMGAVALGIAQGAIDTVMTLAQTKKPGGQQDTLRDRTVFHFQLADAVALVESARAWLYASVEQAWNVAISGRTATREERGRLVLAAANATRSAATATNIAYTAAGATANYLRSPLQRALRDIHALTQHTQTSPQQWERGGRLLLGLDPVYPLMLL
ncbi:MAG: acyl-CoA dehydrogenase family protein [Deltaproteobacteria bacterium]|nr:acyl-CoA dehydrogenase family protein [Deltaproteobacteria bacterium]